MSLTQITQSGIGDQAVSLDKLLHGTPSTNGKFLRANNGADPTFETVDLTSLSASNLTSGTIPNARFPATLPAIGGGSLTGLNASELTSGTIPSGRFGTDTITTTAIASGALPTDVTVASANIVNGTIVDADISGSAAIAQSKIATGNLPSGITVNSSNIVNGSIVDADVNASANIAGTKINANFGSQNISTTGNLSVGGTITGVTTNTATDIQTNANNNVAPVFKNSAGVETARLVKAYVNFNGQSSGTNKTIRDSFNVTSVTDQAVGYYQVNFDRAMADANYSALVTGDLRSPNTRSSGTDCNFYTTQLVRVSSEDNNGNYGTLRADVQILCVCILGNT